MCFSLNISAQLIPHFYGSATSQGGDCYRITEPTTTQRGAVYYDNPVDFNSDFDIIFDANFGNRDAFGADGITFVMKKSFDPIYGKAGGGMGYEDIDNSLGVEFDTWKNGDRGDIDEDHIALIKNGDNRHTSVVDNLAGPVQASATSANIEDGEYHEVKISWRASTKIFRVVFDCEERISYDGTDLVTDVFGGQSEVYFGFVGSTGAYYNLQEVCFKFLSFSDMVALQDQEICYGDSIDDNDATYDGATAYEWSPATGVSDINIPNPIFSPTENTTYTVTITDYCGDKITNSFDVVVIPVPEAEVTAKENPICADSDAEFLITGTPSNLVTYTLDGVEETILLDEFGEATISVVDPVTEPTLELKSVEVVVPSVIAHGLEASGGVDTANAEGIIEAEGLQATTTNSARVGQYTAPLELALEHTVPVGTEIIISAAKVFSYSAMEVTDGTATLRIDTGAINAIEYFSFITEQETNKLTFKGISGYFWIDGVEYTHEPTGCYNDLNDSETINFADLDDASFSLEPTCDGAIVTNTTIPGGTYSIISSTGAGVIDASTGTITGAGFEEVYEVEYITSGSCPSRSTKTVTVYPEPVVSEVDPLLVVCDDNVADGLTEIDLSSLMNNRILGGRGGYVVNYFFSQADADSDTAPLPNPYTNVTNPQTIYARLVDTSTGCYTTTTVELNVEQAPSANIPVPLEYCDSDRDGYAVFNLFDTETEITRGNPDLVVSYHETFSDAENGEFALESPYNNTVAWEQTIYVRVESLAIATDCATVVELGLIVNPTPPIAEPTPLIVCDDSSSDGYTQFDLTLKDSEVLAGLDPTTYLVTYYETQENAESGVGMIDNPLEYTNIKPFSQEIWVRVDDAITGCYELVTLQLLKSTAPTLVAEVASEIFADIHVIVASATGNGSYEYSLDGGPWQESGVFEDVTLGEHVVTARDIMGCGETSATVTVIDYPLFFTPNDDGYNDTWNIVGFSDQSATKIYIFDRLGKLLKQISPTGSGWDGTYNGAPMPSSDYWFLLEYMEPSTGQSKELRAHFTLKR
ncbi:T9SS type B sorting domain-containing protein [Mangrovimonas sp. DI 80]|uniref:lectin-like domain-containing protein n=1 Tax=Mangrovimonas sp. DI 80 TaxID=1779330 RepID=UPI00097723D8|nr:T9SS type B sorting domain-containing protein [Mangrovimonas sp. DI 80]OMP29822.1 hypothetical protein BKM32_16140 [Mangrovimonas sp. DI 80]